MAPDPFSINELYVRRGEVQHIGQPERVEVLDAQGNVIISHEIGMLGRDEEMVDGSGRLLGKMQDKMHIAGMQGYRYRNLMDQNGNLIGTALPRVPDPRPGERQYILKDGNERQVAVAITTQQIYPSEVVIGGSEGNRTLARMLKGSYMGKTDSYKLDIDDSSVPRLLLLEFVISLFLFVLKA